MFPNRLAWPPDLPITVFCVPLTPSVVLPLTSVPALAIFRFSALVRSTVSLGDGGWLKPPGTDWALYGNGCGLPPTLLLLPGTAFACTASIVLSTDVLAVCAGAKPSGAP